MRVTLLSIQWSLALLLGSLLPASIVGADTRTAPRPNIIHIFADDLGKAAVGVNGQLDRAAKGLPHIKTPALDQLANQGLTYTRAYSATVCSPSRGMLYLGFNQAHNANDRNTVNPRSQDITLAQVVKQAGYHTGVFGKWGFGGGPGLSTSRNKADDLRPEPGIEDPDALPTSHGYDHFTGYLNHGRAHKYFLSSLWTTAATDTPVTSGVSELLLGNRGPSNENLHVVYTHDIIARHSEQFIEQHYQDANPFFMQVNYTVPHQDLEAIKFVPGWFDDYAGEDTSDWSEKEKCYAAMVTRMDASVQSLIDKLEDPNSDGDRSDSILAKTLIVFTSDNGATNADFTPSGLNHFGLLDPWRGGKRDLWEGGINVPQFARWDGVIQPGTSTDHLTDLTDFMATIADLAGVDAPVGIDGHSLVPLITGKGTQRARNYLVFEGHERNGGPDPDTRAPRWAIVRGNDKLIKFVGGDLELYDLQSDPTERRPLDLGNRSHRKLADELKALALHDGVEQGPDYAHEYAVWTGDNGASLGERANWNVSNEDRPSHLWSAVVNNSGSKLSQLHATGDMNYLGLEVRGDSARTTIIVAPNAKLTGSNEVRLRSGGQIKLEGGSLLTDRWIDVGDGARLTGHGRIVGDLYNRGKVAPELSAQLEKTKHATRQPPTRSLRTVSSSSLHQPQTLQVAGGVFHSADGVLEVDLELLNGASVSTGSRGVLEVDGVAVLEGALEVKGSADESLSFTPAAGDQYTILTASEGVRGKFSATSLPTLPGDLRWEVSCREHTVVLEVVRVAQPSPTVVEEVVNLQ